MDWEAIGRAVARCKPGDSFNASWASFMGGLAASAVLGFVSIRWTVATNQKPYSAVQILFGLVAVFSALCGFLIYKIEQRARENRAAFLTALKEELDAAEHYMRKLTEKGGS